MAIKSRKTPVEPEYLPRRETAERIGLCVSSLNRVIETFPDFPRPVRLASKIVLFDVAAVRAWMQARATAAADAPQQANGLPVAAMPSLRSAQEERSKARKKTAAADPAPAQ